MYYRGKQLEDCSENEKDLTLFDYSVAGTFFLSKTSKQNLIDWYVRTFK